MHINRLILFAGPPCSGKTTIVASLLSGDLPSLSESLKLGQLSSWRYIQAFEVPELRESEMDKVILHYDILRQWKEKLNGQGYEEDKPLSVLLSADEITFVTLWAPPEVLSRRLKLRQRRVFTSLILSLALKSLLVSCRRTLKVYRLYVDPAAALSLSFQYDKWFDFCDSYGTNENWIIDTTKDQPELLSASERLRISAQFSVRPCQTQTNSTK